MTPRSLEQRLTELVAASDLAHDRADAVVVEQDQREAEGRFLVATPQFCVTGTTPAETG